MAFEDLLLQSNLEGVLTALIECRTVAGGLFHRLAIGDRYMELSLPSPYGDVVVSGVVESWVDFGYTADMINASLMTGDGSLRVNMEPLSVFADQRIDYLLNGTEMAGGRIEIFQSLLGPSGWESESIFRGVVSNLRDIDNTGVTIEFTDTSGLLGLIPPTEVTRVDFDDAPDESIGVAIPIIYGDFEDSNYSYAPVTGTEIQLLGHGGIHGVPPVLVERNFADNAVGPKHRISSHELRSLDAYRGAVFLEPEEEMHGQMDESLWSITNTADYCDLNTDWPLSVTLAIIPDKRMSPNNRVTNPERATDRDKTTYAVINADTATGQLTQGLRNVANLGYIKQIQVAAWLRAGGTGTAELAMWKGGTYWGTNPSTFTAITGNEQIIYHTPVVADAWPHNDWQFEKYGLFMQLPVGQNVDVRALVLLVEYVPGRKVISRTRPGNRVLWGGLKKGIFGGNLQFTDRERWEKPNPGLYTFPVGHNDDTGEYTGTAPVGNVVIEFGADIVHHLLDTYSSLTADDLETGTGIGNFDDARAELGNLHRLRLWVGEQIPLEETLARIGRQCRAIPIQNNSGKHGLVVISKAPAYNYLVDGSAFKFSADEHIIKGTFRCGRTPVEGVANKVVIDFDYSHETREFRKSAFITRSNSDNGFGTRDENGSGDREDQASDCYDRIGAEQEFRLQCPEIYKQGVAKPIRNYWFDTLIRTRLWASFETHHHACTLSVGHVVGFADVETIFGVKPPNPYEASKDWDDYKFYVESTTRVQSSDSIPRYRIQLIEAIIPDTASDWVAAVDDT